MQGRALHVVPQCHSCLALPKHLLLSGMQGWAALLMGPQNNTAPSEAASCALRALDSRCAAQGDFQAVSTMLKMRRLQTG